MYHILCDIKASLSVNCIIIWHSYMFPSIWIMCLLPVNILTHWGRVMHICVSKLTIIGSDYGLSPGQRQAIIWTDAGILLMRTLVTNFSEKLREIHTFSFKKMHLKLSSAKWHPFCLDLNVFTHGGCTTHICLHCFSYWLVTCSVPSHYLN